MLLEGKEEGVFLASCSVDVTFYSEGAMWTIQEEGKGNIKKPRERRGLERHKEKWGLNKWM